MAQRVLRARLLRAAVAVLLMAACSREDPTREAVPLPALPQGPIELRVMYLENERLPRLAAQDIARVLESAAAAVKAHFGREIRFATPDLRPIAAHFRAFDENDRRVLAQYIYDFKRGTGDVRRLETGLENDMRRFGDDLDATIGYAQPHLITPVRERSYVALARALVATQLSRIRSLASARAADGKPVLDEQPYNEFVFWDAMAHPRPPYEVVVTNQLIASVEYAGNSVHSALRGGITNGVTSANPAARFGTTSVVSVYPFLSADAVVRTLRGGEHYARADAMRYAGVLLAHELGHQFWHLGHPYGRTACVMSPTPMLHFRVWVEALAPAQCPLAGDGQMKPGTAKIYPATLR